MYTGLGDNGTTTLYADTARYAKNAVVFDALGTLDELNSLIGVVKARARQFGAIVSELARVQESLFIIQAEIAGAPKTLSADAVLHVERVIHGIENREGNPGSFLVSGASELSAFLDFARAVSRRAERAVLSVSGSRPVSGISRAYLNRLSSLLFALARDAASKEGIGEAAPQY